MRWAAPRVTHPALENFACFLVFLPFVSVFPLGFIFDSCDLASLVGQTRGTLGLTGEVVWLESRIGPTRSRWNGRGSLQLVSPARRMAGVRTWGRGDCIGIGRIRGDSTGQWLFPQRLWRRMNVTFLLIGENSIGPMESLHFLIMIWLVLLWDPHFFTNHSHLTVKLGCIWTPGDMARPRGV